MVEQLLDAYKTDGQRQYAKDHTPKQMNLSGIPRIPAPPSEIFVDNYQHSGIVDDANLSLSPRLNNAAYMTGFE